MDFKLVALVVVFICYEVNGHHHDDREYEYGGRFRPAGFGGYGFGPSFQSGGSGRPWGRPWGGYYGSFGSYGGRPYGGRPYGGKPYFRPPPPSWWQPEKPGVEEPGVEEPEVEEPGVEEPVEQPEIPSQPPQEEIPAEPTGEEEFPVIPVIEPGTSDTENPVVE